MSARRAFTGFYSLTIEMLKFTRQEENFPVPVACGVFASGMTMEKQRGA
jgi:hypothetical protein